MTLQIRGAHLIEDGQPPRSRPWHCEIPRCTEAFRSEVKPQCPKHGIDMKEGEHPQS